MKRLQTKWILLAACLALAFAGMLAVTGRLVVLAGERNEAQRRAAVDDATRLALWRLDTAAAALLAGESARPVETYVEVAQVSEGLARAVAGRFSREGEGAGRAQQQWGALDDAKVEQAMNAAPTPKFDDQQYLARQAKDDAADSIGDVSARSLVQRSSKLSLGEYQARSKAVANTFAATRGAATKGSAAQKIPVERAPARPEPGAFAERWTDGDLYLVREASFGAGRIEQGARLPWATLEPLLLAEIRDLLPAARLVRGASDEPLRRMAALAIRLEPGTLPPGEAPVETSVWPELAMAWAGVLAAALALAVLLAGALRLSERRAAFVSAVTHELRTPLTTFRLYTEMLKDGMVPDEARRAQYLGTLWSEAGRLAHLVDNVLAYSRIEQGRRPPAPTGVALGDLIERWRPRLEERLSQAGMTLDVQVDPALRARAEPGALEQVVFNLVDNAAKYAASGDVKRVEIRAARAGAGVEVSVRDYGPGLSAEARRDLFVPFSKSAARAAESAPGVGLGLALCRQLVGACGGALRHEPAEGGGARFVVRLGV